MIPYKKSNLNKTKQIEHMFDSISNSYDTLNQVFSFGFDAIWRKKALTFLNINDKYSQLLDVATGTGDLAIEAYEKFKCEKIIGVDLSEKMLNIAKKKIIQRNLTSKISFFKENAENLSFENEKFDVVMIAFGIRNFQNFQKGLDEFYRVLKPGGTCLILEFSKPQNKMFKFFYWILFQSIIPFIGRLVSRDDSAYSYLPKSIQRFPQSNEFKVYMKNAKFNNIEIHKMTMGVCTVYLDMKP